MTHHSGEFVADGMPTLDHTLLRDGYRNTRIAKGKRATAFKVIACSKPRRSRRILEKCRATADRVRRHKEFYEVRKETARARASVAATTKRAKEREMLAIKSAPMKSNRPSRTKNDRLRVGKAKKADISCEFKPRT